MAFIYDLADTWAAAGTVFTAIKLNVTDTDSASTSNLMDLQVGGVSKFKVGKTGDTLGNRAFFYTTPQTIVSASSFGFGFSNTNGLVGTYSSGQLGILAGSKFHFGNKNSTFEVEYGISIGWSATPGSGHGGGTLSGDLYVYRDAANTLAQRNGANNPQAFNIYNTYTDANNYERGFMRWTSNVFEIGTQAGTTGTGRNISISLGGTGSQNVSIATAYFQGFNLLYNGTPFIEFRKYSGGGTTGWVSNSSDMHYRWTSTSSSAIEGDVGIKRDSAGVLKITNGNNAATGAGKLIFIVPTTDPGITGALWNNAGTLSISA